VREGPQGARSPNARIEDLLAGIHRGAGPASSANRHFHGRLLLTTENSYRHRLFNGDIGVCLQAPSRWDRQSVSAPSGAAAYTDAYRAAAHRHWQSLPRRAGDLLATFASLISHRFMK
jgi:ATP-dependent exoDNAse (exonuclease V) alpha subunit